MNKMKIFIAAILITFCTACSTLKTVAPDRGRVDISSQGFDSNCNKIPRIYSGVSYNLCLLNSESNSNAIGGVGLMGVPLIFIDTVCSAVADTVFLPYTIYTQVNDGSINVN
jgi:uncharacterized protein YceK